MTTIYIILAAIFIYIAYTLIVHFIRKRKAKEDRIFEARKARIVEMNAWIENPKYDHLLKFRPTTTPLESILKDVDVIETNESKTKDNE